jgi:hypothetical protein
MSDEIKSGEIPTVEEYLNAYMDGTPPVPSKSIRDIIMDKRGESWSAEDVSNFDGEYNKQLTSGEYQMSIEYHILSNYQNDRLIELEEQAMAAVECGAATGSTDLYKYPLLADRIRFEATDYATAEGDVYAATNAYSKMGYGEEVDNIRDYYHNHDEREKAVQEAQDSLAARNKMNLVRGAMLWCDCGSHPRRLNLRTDHGVLIRDKPQIHEEDAVPDTDDPTNPNICWFGHCSSKADIYEPLTETIRLRAYAPTDEFGNYLTPPSENTSVGIKCKPRFLNRGWKNCDESVSLSQDNHNTVGGFKKYYNVATTQSYIMCVHGGIIYAVSSGQDEFNAYVPPFYECIEKNIPRDLAEGSAFMKWCNDNAACPYWPGEDGYDAWYADRIQASKTSNQDRIQTLLEEKRSLQEKINNDPAGDAYVVGDLYYRPYDALYGKIDDIDKELAESQNELDTYMSKWIDGIMQSGVATDDATRSKIDSGNSVMTAYFGETPPEIDSLISDLKQQYGSLSFPHY